MVEDTPLDRVAVSTALDTLVHDGVLIRYDYVDHGDNWQLTRSEEGQPYLFSIEQVHAYIAGVHDAKKSN